MSFLDDIVRPIVSDVLAEYGTTCAVTLITRSVDKATLRETQSAAPAITLACTRRDFSSREVTESGGRILAGDVQLTFAAEDWEAALAGGNPLPRTAAKGALLFGVVEGDGTAKNYTPVPDGVRYGVAQALAAVYRWQLRRA